jgi:hypothetical protein
MSNLSRSIWRLVVFLGLILACVGIPRFIKFLKDFSVFFWAMLGITWPLLQSLTPLFILLAILIMLEVIGIHLGQKTRHKIWTIGVSVFNVIALTSAIVFGNIF